MYAVTVSLPLRYLTYSAWMSGERWNDGMMERAVTARIARPPNHSPFVPTFQRSILPSITHPPDLPAHVVAHQQRAIRSHNDAHRTPPARPVGPLPSRDEIVDRDGAAVLYVDAHHLIARGHRAVPGTVEGHEGIAAIVRGEGGACVKVHPERC